MPTVSLSNLKGATLRVKPPRTLLTGLPRGQTVGAAGDVPTQRAVVRAALELLEMASAGGEIREFAPV
ncbi:MAG: hypothetical protein M3R24_32470 [Chloroflexota bacterium]|nr:hypothetical protein [Chloroflexota bacterium]